VEDDAIVRSWVRASLEGSEFRLAGEASSAGEGLKLTRRRRVELILVDYRLPDRAGTEFVRELRRLRVNTPAVLMTASPEPGLNEAAREAGANGSTLKTGSRRELLEILRAVLGGEMAFDPRHPRRPPGRTALSPREREVLRHIAAGRTNREIAAALGVGEQTVKTLLGRAFLKLGVGRRAEAVAAAQERGLL
jgi:DNA-binding NarL/FixJ family response regulator